MLKILVLKKCCVKNAKHLVLKIKYCSKHLGAKIQKILRLKILVLKRFLKMGYKILVLKIQKNLC